MGARVSWLILLQLCSVVVRGYENVGFDGWYQPVPHQPVDIITDVINDLGARILQQYTAHGNVAFSPTGVGFVLAALYEGSAGRGKQQIADVLGLPRDRDVTRIGFRDIHRRLRTYLNADGFLGGLMLNQENTRLRTEYEDILRFYGFDLSVPEDETNDTTPLPETTSETGQPMTDTKIFTETTTPSSETMTITPSTEALSTMDEQDRLTRTTPGSTILMDGTTVPDSTTISSGTTSVATTSTLTTIAPAIATQSTTAAITTVQSRSEGTANDLSTSTAATIIPPSVTSELTAVPAGQTESIEPVPESTTTSATASTAATITASSVDTLPTTPLVNITEPTSGSTIPTTAGSTDGPPADENTVSTGSNNQSVPNEMGSIDSPVTIATGETGSTEQTTTASTAINRRKRSVRSPRGFFSSYPDEGIWMQDLGIWKPYSPTLNEATVRDSTEISFLVNGCDVSSVTATRYFAVLPFAYFPSLHAVALEFPLDDPRYNIILMMSTDRRDTYRLARDLGGKSLRLLRKQLQATWVRATIPSFMLRGFVTLTSFLQRLGIVDVFEPRAADLSPMSPDLGVYARDVQQSIGVNIRNYMKPDRTHSRNGLFERAGPVPFTVVQPFLYFIVDAETSVTLIAGRVNDPLNSRIL
ncbi:uncharacterized protein LOC108631811 isoform X2 [Ceratina calcarata]|uniref:Uncharacterized protein LOC108631811 isoform X2 n=1 Tax=Ceratina calcarata TaxID=156304 RepID=A0AAJ7JEB1_9HYME|nr:uncharacterized protein LOC108631811 isoform X2 [Ceratina calcarata]